MQKWHQDKRLTDKLRGAKITFSHFRMGGEENGKHSIPYATLCHITLEGDVPTTFTSMAAVEPGSAFSYRVGRKASEGRARKAIAASLKIAQALQARPAMVTKGEDFKNIIPVSYNTNRGPRFMMGLQRENATVETLSQA
jgi:hypothetical protein